MNNCAKYQHPKKKFSIFLKNHKITFLHFFEGLKKWALQRIFFLHFFLCFIPLMNNCTKFAALRMKFQT